MRVKKIVLLAGLAGLVGLTTWAGDQAQNPAKASKTPSKQEMSIVPDVEKRLAQYSPTPMEADLSALSDEDRRVLAKLAEASRAMNDIFLRQAWLGNPALAKEAGTWKGAQGEAAREYFWINFGPWDRLAERAPFLGDKPHPEGAGFYPEDMTKAEFEAWLKKNPKDKESFESTVTVIRRQGDRLVAVPYSKEYAEWLKPSAQLLREAAKITSNASLKKFLELRADAFLSDDYYASDMAWMDVQAPVEITIGPYETYEDSLFGYKAAFESFLTVALPEESRALDRYKARLPWFEKNLPIPDEHKNLTRGSESPIFVGDVVLTAGDSLAGVQTLAYNLPNDERVREAKGSKKVLLRNTIRAKYDKVLVPIAERVLVPEQVKDVSFRAYFDEILHHELSHGLGPGLITVNGQKVDVRLAHKELYSTLEEAKADVMGVYNILALIKEGEMPKELRQSLEPTYVAGLFRSARFGVDEAHGQGVVAQFNYLMEKGALEVDANDRFRAVPAKFEDGLRSLLRDILMLQATGDYEGAKAFLDKYGKATPSLRKAIGRLGDVPVDIRPVYAFK
jgi:hypothetical protein